MSRNWYVVRAKPRCDSQAAASLERNGFDLFFPRVQVAKPSGAKIEEPLFPGYLFGCCSGGERLRAMCGGHPSQWLEVADQETLLAELRSICVASMQGTGIKLYPRLRRGKWVRVVNGPIAGVRGRISRRKESYRSVLEMTALQSAVSVEVGHTRCGNRPRG